MAKVRTTITSGAGTTTRSSTQVTRWNQWAKVATIGLLSEMDGAAFKKYFEEVRLIFSHERMRCGPLPPSTRDIYITD